MKKFVFSMQKILDLRIFEQQEAEAELGKANAEVSRIRRELDAVARERLSAVRETDGRPGDFAFYAQSETFLLFLDRRQEELLEELTRAELVAEEKRAVVRKAMQNVKVLERLKDNKLTEWKRERLAQEELALDDVVTASYN